MRLRPDPLSLVKSRRWAGKTFPSSITLRCAGHLVNIMTLPVNKALLDHHYVFMDLINGPYDFHMCYGVEQWAETQHSHHYPPSWSQCRSPNVHVSLFMCVEVCQMIFNTTLQLSKHKGFTCDQLCLKEWMRRDPLKKCVLMCPPFLTLLSSTLCWECAPLPPHLPSPSKIPLLHLATVVCQKKKTYFCSFYIISSKPEGCRIPRKETLNPAHTN